MDMFEKEGVSGDTKTIAKIRPLADRMRPRNLNEFVGQEKIVGRNSPLRKAIEQDKVSSILFWGPPGTGKTTLAELIANSTQGQFIPFSAVSSTITQIKQVISKAGSYFKLSGRRTYIFVDEIHRFNKAQQDAFLPYVEKGDIILIGATTENPSFEVISALLSRMRVYVLERLSAESLMLIIKSAVSDRDRGLGEKELTLVKGGCEFIASAADGDARRALTLLETTANYIEDKKSIEIDDLKAVHQRGFTLYDKNAEEHYNIISALHKSMRGGDPNASLYWLARMLESGEGPLYVVRRLVRFATEDIGLADPYALTLALNAKETYQFLGSPEGELAIAELVIYLACAPKSNSVYLAFKQAISDVHEHGSLPVPLEIRNAPTKLMKNLGYGKNYQYAHDFDDALTDQIYFPEKLADRRYYHPKPVGREVRMSEYLEKFLEYRKSVSKTTEE